MLLCFNISKDKITSQKGILNAPNMQGRNFLYIPKATNERIDEYGANQNLSTALINDIKIFAGCVYQFTEMRKMEKSRINHEFFKALFRDTTHGGARGYRVIKKHALSCVLEMKEHKVGKRSCVYWIKPELIDDDKTISIYTEHPIPIRQFYDKNEEFENRVRQLNEFLDNIYLPRMGQVDYNNKFGEIGNKLLKQHVADGTISDKKKFTLRKLSDNINKVDNAISGLNHSVADKDGRIYNIMTYLKREMRLSAGMNLSEIDISSSQPYILAVVLNNLFENKRGKSQDFFIKRIEKLMKTHGKSSAQSVVELIACIKRIRDKQTIDIKQSY